MYRIAVVDDQAEERARLIGFLNRFAAERKLALTVTAFEGGESFLSSYDDNFEIVLLDIEMQGIDGMETARRLRERDETVCLLFVTYLSNYAVQGYSVRALDFLVKPVSYENFCIKMERALTAADHARKKEILVSTPEGDRRIRIDELYYVEVMNHTLLYHTKDGVLSVRGTIRDCEERLAAFDFSRCNKSYLVNMNHVTEIRRNEIRVGGELLPIGSTKRKEFLKQLTEFMGEIVL
ncbi:MAG: response regulator transcription factor [Oscillospiraceae bacterium]|nr:response regulator transcription factor [Oscillospiraceae bacterium]